MIWSFVGILTGIYSIGAALYCFNASHIKYKQGIRDDEAMWVCLGIIYLCAAVMAIIKGAML